MPHPERASEAILGSADGRLIFESMIALAATAPEQPPARRMISLPLN